MGADRPGFKNTSLLVIEIPLYNAEQEKLLNLDDGDYVVIQATEEGMLIKQQRGNFPQI